MKKKSTRQARNIYVKLALFRKAGSHRKSNKAIRRLEKSKIRAARPISGGRSFEPVGNSRSR